MPLPFIIKRIYLACSALKESKELQKLSKSTKYEAGEGRLREKESGNWWLGRGFFGVSVSRIEGRLIRGFRVEGN